ncbi:uncharacterized protein ATNIH1004_010637 [Aspergillus tanneri]|uniref:RNase H type-1 domain-containing protein n=1 Tax=Aspergillus tanneri TaxID=1220188 RepID=A0A5M9MA10_9EURO|nr:uncharacterized protein ATNIH1004_010637 [Aspergillus tanneri]KAA8643862.1 hypothetical protein ATNIH1004_010637 [Aspergillus tanneri]
MERHLPDTRSHPTPWSQPLNQIIDISISSKLKEQTAQEHKALISQWLAGRDNHKIIFYSDGSQLQSGQNGAGIFLQENNPQNQKAWAWNLGHEYEVYDAELFAIQKH